MTKLIAAFKTLRKYPKTAIFPLSLVQELFTIFSHIAYGLQKLKAHWLMQHK
jgi:hypothetical protein